MIYEFRTYTMHPGRQDAICRRFSEGTLQIFKRLGMKVTNFWVDADGKEMIYYIMEFENKEAMATAWATFKQDPEWKALKAESELDGPIVKEVVSNILEVAPFFK